MDSITIGLIIIVSIGLPLAFLMPRIKRLMKNWIVNHLGPAVMRSFLKKNETKFLEDALQSERKAKAGERRAYNAAKRETMAKTIRLGLKVAVESMDEADPKRGLLQAFHIAIETNVMGIRDSLEKNPEAFMDTIQGLMSGNMLQAGLGGMQVMGIDLGDMLKP